MAVAIGQYLRCIFPLQSMVVATHYSSSKEVFLMYRTEPYSWNEMNGLIIAVYPNEEVATFETTSVATAGS